jgi:hypothetical protein
MLRLEAEMSRFGRRKAGMTAERPDDHRLAEGGCCGCCPGRLIDIEPSRRGFCGELCGLEMPAVLAAASPSGLSTGARLITSLISMAVYSLGNSPSLAINSSKPICRLLPVQSRAVKGEASEAAEEEDDSWRR